MTTETKIKSVKPFLRWAGGKTWFIKHIGKYIPEEFDNYQRIKWISRFNSYRNLWAHEGTKEKRLNKEEVEFLEKKHKHFYDKK